MPRWIAVLVLAFIVLVFAGLGLVYIQRSRVAAEMARCQNHLREIALFGSRFAEAAPEKPALVDQIPPGTIPNLALPPEERLSWYVVALPWLDQKRLPKDLLDKLDLGQPWSSQRNTEAARLKLPMLLCPGMPPEVIANQPAPTSYFGTAGLGLDAATLRVRKVELRLGNFGHWQPWLIPPGAGCYRYDAPTPFAAIADGMAQTIMIGEREPSPGAWLQGGPSTVRGFDTSPGAPLPVGTGGQFGGGHPAAANFAYADGHVMPIAITVSREVLETQLTIAGGSSIDP